VSSFRRSAGSFRYALIGLEYLVRSQPNFRIHVILASLAVGLGLILGLAPGEWAVLALTIGMVLAAETINTALETVLDLLHPGHHELAGLAKDLAAAAVFLAALASLAVAGFLFVPRLWRLL
jgi:diacylglycerol kinase (ATP)